MSMRQGVLGHGSLQIISYLNRPGAAPKQLNGFSPDNKTGTIAAPAAIEKNATDSSDVHTHVYLLMPGLPAEQTGYTSVPVHYSKRRYQLD